MKILKKKEAQMPNDDAEYNEEYDEETIETVNNNLKKTHEYSRFYLKKTSY
jgi:hypothetical protein